MIKRIPYARVVCDGNEQAYVTEVLASGWLTTAGRAHEFEGRFANAVHAPYACAVTSCTAALHLALEALGIGANDKVLVPTWTFTATAEIVRYLGADPVFLDVDFRTNLLTPAIVAEGLRQNPDAKALIVVHFGGQAAYMTDARGEGILEICRRHGVAVVEDAAHAFPARFGGRMVGTFGDVTCFSFYANKTITTGEGGMLVTANERLFDRAKVMRLHGIDRDVWNRFISDKPSWEYDVIAPGYKYNMPDVNAAIGLAQLERAEELRHERERCARFYLEAFADARRFDLPGLQVPFQDHAWHLFPIVLKPEAPMNRNRFIEELAERGVGTSVHYKPVHRLSYYAQRYGLKPEGFPNAERIWPGCVSLPIYPSLSREDLEYVAAQVLDLLENRVPAFAVHGAAPEAIDIPRPTDGAADESAGCATEVPPPMPPGRSGVDRPLRRIRLSVPQASGREMAYIQSAFQSNWLSTVGPNLDELEARFAAMVGSPALAVSCGTSAIHLGLKLLGVGPGDEVLVPSLTFVASCNPVLYQGARPVFVDSERCSWNLAPDLLEDFLKRRAAANRVPKALIIVHLFGQSADLDPIVSVCRQYGVGVLEDAAEALGALYRGRPVGTSGDVTVFSFNGNKVITATGGGVLTSPHQHWVQRARHWSTQASDPDPLRMNNYCHSEVGYNYRLSNVLAGIALGQLEVLDDRIRQRRAIFDRYWKALSALPGIEPQPEARYEPRSTRVSASDAPSFLHTRWLSCFLVNEAEFGMSAGALVQFLDANNIEARPVWKPMHTQKLYQGYECVGGAIAEDLNRRGVCLPSSSSLSLEDQTCVIDCICRAHESRS